ncbi:hydantoinase/oxoprolinase N-terminal domain-containing protein [Mycolicibacterium goodii]|uniref:hydantoinase/oxoprolinase N-terminal domain-containing protein n=1 Tax=Mycolicibacterium goodii TaxID=134601 RepID=UPI001BDDC2CF|nr:hydantoinase/oxoprolinase family protein [Mycolicibacterium goodii]MBU8828275.1 hydantoinase/oxoprolinase family protein [Mycolicibacterium goodii]
MRLGIDVGGTNTDVVLLEGTTIRATCKSPTTPDITSGIRDGIEKLLSTCSTRDVDAVVIGTTHFINAVTQAKHLARTASIRLATPPQTLMPLTDWPEPLAAACNAGTYVVRGGTQFDGRPLHDLDEPTLREIAQEIRRHGTRHIAISGTFSPLDPAAEERTAQILLEEIPEASSTVSHEIGRIGLLGRENAAILNESLRPLAGSVASAFTDILDGLDLSAPIFITGNDGTLMTLGQVEKYPIFAIGSGPTNSMRGAAALCGLAAHDAAVVIDIGGTTTDIGLLRAGFTRESTVSVDLGGVRSNFRMPDVASLAIGGGSIVDVSTGLVGPASVGYRLTSDALVFGGSTLTFTDIAVRAGFAQIGDVDAVRNVPRQLVERALAYVRDKVNALIEQTKMTDAQTVISVVGGGAPLIAPLIAGATEVPTEPGSANAVGAAMAMAGGEVDRIESLAGTSRDDVLIRARVDARDRAVTAGADPATVRIVDEEDIPLSHLPGGTAIRVRVRAVGDMQLKGALL